MKTVPISGSVLETVAENRNRVITVVKRVRTASYKVLVLHGSVNLTRRMTHGFILQNARRGRIVSFTLKVASDRFSTELS